MSIYDILGGDGPVGQAVEQFYSKLRSDPIIGEFLQQTDLAKLTTHQRMFLRMLVNVPLAPDVWKLNTRLPSTRCGSRTSSVVAGLAVT